MVAASWTQLVRLVIVSMQDMLVGADDKMIEGDHVMAFSKQPIAEVRTQETSASRDKNVHNTTFLSGEFLSSRADEVAWRR
jgi:hypothetical protein